MEKEEIAFIKEWDRRSASERVKEKSENGKVFHLIPADMQNDKKFLMDAVKANPMNLRDVIRQTPELCNAAIEGSWRAIRYVKSPTYQQCQKALLYSEGQRDRAYSYMGHADYSVWTMLMKNGGEALARCPDRLMDKEMCWHAVNFDFKALGKVPERHMSYELCDYVWNRADDETKREIFAEIPEKYRNAPFCRDALKIDPNLLEFVPERVQKQIPDACERALARDPSVEDFLKIDIERPRQAMGMAM